MRFHRSANTWDAPSAGTVIRITLMSTIALATEPGIQAGQESDVAPKPLDQYKTKVENGWVCSAKLFPIQ